jgi:hypothetical protein
MKQAKTKKKGLKHHVKQAFYKTPKFIHGMVTGAFVGIMVVVGIRASGIVNALSISSPRDCDSNAVITCGALTTAELQQRYKNKGVASIYDYFKISASDISNIHENAVAGRVYKDGKVTVEGITVATGARTAGRENIAGSTKVTSGGVTFYTRAPSVSFHPDYINAFVIMDSGQFKFAILGACGNPVSATAVPKKTTPAAPVVKKPVETPTTPAETPKPTITTMPSTQTPPSTPQVILASNTTPTQLPNAGPGAAILIAVASVIGGYVFHMTHRHVTHKRRLKHTGAIHPPHMPLR